MHKFLNQCEADLTQFCNKIIIIKNCFWFLLKLDQHFRSSDWVVQAFLFAHLYDHLDITHIWLFMPLGKSLWVKKHFIQQYYMYSTISV